MRSIARWCVAHRRAVLATWLAALIGLSVIGHAVGTSYRNSFSLDGTQSFKALHLLERVAPKASGDEEQVVIAVAHGSLDAPAIKARAQHMFGRISRLPEVASVVSPYSRAGASQVSSSGRVAFANVVLHQQASTYSTAQARRFVDTARSGEGGGLTVAVEGEVAQQTIGNSVSSAGLGAAAALIVMLIVFGSLAAALLPLIAAGIALGTAIAIIGLVSHAITTADFSSELALLIGLGVGVDYALFIVTRHRQGLHRGMGVEEAIVEAVDTGGRAVMFAGITVCIALLGMFALGVGFLYGVAVAAAIAVALTVFAALTLLPALLGFLGPHVLGRRARRALAAGKFKSADGGRLWARWATVLHARPAWVAGLALVLMAVIAIPFFSMRLGSSDAGADPPGSTTRVAYDLLAEGFGPGYNGPLQLVAEVRSHEQRQAFAGVAHVVSHTAGVVSVSEPAILPGRGGASPVESVNVYPVGSPQAASTSRLLTMLRDQIIPRASTGSHVQVLVGGQTAIFADFASVLSSKLPLFIGVVVGLSLLLLIAVFRSLAVPAMAAAMNMLSAGAGFGVIVAVFQWGWAARLFGVNETGPIEAFIPVMMFAILFGLSMDYEVFLVRRIYEEWHRTRNPRLAVTHGLTATGRTITAAASIMVLVFASFILGGQVVIEMFGLGLAGAVLMDALIVRMAIVPGLLILLGRAGWWLPRAFDRVVPRLNVEGSAIATKREQLGSALEDWSLGRREMAGAAGAEIGSGL